MPSELPKVALFTDYQDPKVPKDMIEYVTGLGEGQPFEENVDVFVLHHYGRDNR